VSGIVIKDGHVGFTIEIDPSEKDSADALRSASESAVRALDSVLSATAMLTAHQGGSTAPQDDTPPGTPIGSGQAASREPLKPARDLIAVASGKGGVGKSTTSINLAPDRQEPEAAERRQENLPDRGLGSADHVDRLSCGRGCANDLAGPDGDERD
jgi:hypothetical protein